MSALLKPKEAARYLGVSVTTLRTLPIARVVISERLIRYRVEDLDAFSKDRAGDEAA